MEFDTRNGYWKTKTVDLQADEDVLLLGALATVHHSETPRMRQIYCCETLLTSAGTRSIGVAIGQVPGIILTDLPNEKRA
jgi:hypothetical protein